MDEGLKLKQKKNADIRRKAKVLDDLRLGNVVWVSAGSIYSIPEISRYLVLRKNDISYFRSSRYQFDRSLPPIFPVQEE